MLNEKTSINLKANKPLTSKETAILDLLVAGRSRKQIAKELKISAHTIKFHCNNILAKFDANSMLVAAVNYARGVMPEALRG